MKCKQCGREFPQMTVVQKYCSSACGAKYRRTHDMKAEYPSISFRCAKCGRMVVTDGTSQDKRTRFCSAECEKNWWRHPPYEHDHKNQNFRSIAAYASWERRTNE